MNKSKMMGVAIIWLTLAAFLFHFIAWFWGNRGNWVYFGIYLTGSVIIAMWAPAILICSAINKVSDKLEKLIEKQGQN